MASPTPLTAKSWRIPSVKKKRSPHSPPPRNVGNNTYLKSGFEPHPKDFSPKLSDRQIVVLTERMNDIGAFKRDVTAEEITRLLLCEHKEPLQITH
jgi:hypothetical protein